MENVVFALPTVNATDMTPNDQGALLVNQATAVIIAAWLAHETAVYVAAGGLTNGAHVIHEPGLVSTINAVQAALSGF